MVRMNQDEDVVDADSKDEERNHFNDDERRGNSAVTE